MAERGQFAFLLLLYILILILIPTLCALADRFRYINPDFYCTVFHISRHI